MTRGQFAHRHDAKGNLLTGMMPGQFAYRHDPNFALARLDDARAVGPYQAGPCLLLQPPLDLHHVMLWDALSDADYQSELSVQCLLNCFACKITASVGHIRCVETGIVSMGVTPRIKDLLRCLHDQADSKACTRNIKYFKCAAGTNKGVCMPGMQQAQQMYPHNPCLCATCMSPGVADNGIIVALVCVAVG